MINIPNQICVLFQTNNSYINKANNTRYIENSFIMAYGKSKKEIKAKEKKLTQYDELVIVENTIMPGFVIKKSTKNSYSGYFSANWVVCDPRGFETYISTENLEYILRNATISNGLINEVCVWTRSDNDMKLFLTPLSDEHIFQELLTNTELMNEKVDPKSIEIGDKIMLQSGLVGTYMGKFNLYGKYTKYFNKEDKYTYIIPQVYRNKQVLQVDNSKFYFATDLDPLKIIDKCKTTTSVKQTLLDMNKKLQEDHSKFLFYDGPIFNSQLPKNYLFCRDISFITKCTTAKVKMHLEEITNAEAEEISEKIKDNSTLTLLVLEDSGGQRFIIHEQLRRINYTLFNMPKKPNFRKSSVIINSQVFYNIPVKNPHVPDDMPSENFLSDFVKYYKVVKTVPNQSFI